jgi:vancomycin permeability regulator SanA
VERTPALLQLALVYVVVAMWPYDLFIILLLLGLLGVMLVITNRLVEFSQKKSDLNDSKVIPHKK